MPVKNGYNKKDWAIALALAVIVFALTVLCLGGGSNWGDDFAAYIAEGIAIAKGEFHEQTEINYILHNSVPPEEAAGRTWVYVWGYPLMLAGVYKLFGYDTELFSSMLYYKLPSALCLALLAAVIFLFYRRRFNRALSLFLAAFLCLNMEFVNFVNYYVCSDMVFLAFAFLSLLLGELFCNSNGGGRRIFYALLLGAALWMTCEIRLNGILILVPVALGQLFFCLREVREGRKGLKYLSLQILPYIVFLALKIISEQLIFAPATSTVSDLGWLGLPRFLDNLAYYYQQLLSWLGGLLPHGSGWIVGTASKALLLAACALIAAGVIFGEPRRNAPLTFYFAVILLGVCMLPYVQGLRYIYSLLPLLIMYMGYGLCVVARLLSSWRPDITRLKYGAAALYAVAAVLLINNILPVAQAGAQMQRGSDSSLAGGAYSEAAVDMYRYIQTNTAQEDIILFEKSRLLYLNTGRLSLWDIEDADEADYVLLYNSNTQESRQLLAMQFQPEYSNDELTLYKSAGA